MKEQIVLQKILQEKFSELRTHNPKFSPRAFSKKLGLSPGATSELLHGQRTGSLKIAKRIAANLSLNPQERIDLFDSFTSKNKAIPSEKIDPSYLQLTADQFHIVGDWYHFSILCLMRTKSFKSDAGWIASRLGLPKSTIQTGIDRLIRVGLIKKDTHGNLIRSKSRYRTTDDIASSSIRQAHFQYIEKAKEALETLPVNQRDFTSLMMTVSPEQIPIVKEKIRKFREELSNELESKPQADVFQLCIHFFPLTKIRGDNK